MTSTPGSTGQDPNSDFTFTGVLTGNIVVLWPQGKTRKFSATNSTTGAFTLSLGVNNGSGLPAGTTAALVQGQSGLFKSDGTNVVAQIALTNAVPWAVAGGSANAITATYSPPNLSLSDGLLLTFRAMGANTTTTPTFAPDGLTAHTITKFGGTALNAGDIPNALAECLVRYNLANTRWELIDPAPSTTAGTWAAAGGSADAITITCTPPNITLSDGLLLGFRASAANTTTTPTFAPDGLTAHTITKYGGQALAAGDIARANAECLVRYNLANTRWEFLNPSPPATATISNNLMMANISGSTAAPSGTTATAYLDSVFGANRGRVLVRGVSTWAEVGPGSNGQFLGSNGTDLSMMTPSNTPPAGSVHQGMLNTSSGGLSFAGLTTSSQALPGGSWGFYPTTTRPYSDSSGTALIDGFFVDASGYSSSAAWIGFNQSLTNNTATANQIYINASPPYDLGDGPVNGFIFLKVENGSGRILATYSADVPPWVYNGPTDVRPHVIDEAGKKFRRVKQSAVTLDDVQRGRASMREYIDSPCIESLHEITQADYHADIALLPHPFGNHDPSKSTALLLDPMHPLVARLIAEQNLGNRDVWKFLHSDRLRFGNEPLNRHGPPGVMQVRILD